MRGFVREQFSAAIIQHNGKKPLREGPGEFTFGAHLI
jgi:hypothetical protein